MFSGKTDREIKVSNPSLGITRKVTVVFDIDAIDPQCVLEAAVKSWVIDAQRKLRGDDTIRGISDGDSLTFNPADFGTRERVSGVEKARRAIATLTDEDLATLGLTRSDQ